MLKQVTILLLLLTGSTVATLFFLFGVTVQVDLPVKWVLYFPFYGILYLSSSVWQLMGIRTNYAILFLAGVVFSALYNIVLLEKLPRKVTYVIVGILFFMVVLVMGRSVFVMFLYIPQQPLRAALYSVKVFVEFLIGLGLIYLVLGEVDVPFLDRRGQ